jgi:hypothetical protein
MTGEGDEFKSRLRDMYAAHTLFRRELSLASALVTEVVEDDGRKVGLVCDHLGLILGLLALYREVRGDCPALSRIADHVAVLTKRWRVSGWSPHGKQLSAALERLAFLLNEHMTRQEEALLWPRTASLTGQPRPPGDRGATS